MRQRKERWSFHPGEVALRVTAGLVLGIIIFLFAGPFFSGAAALAAVAAIAIGLVAALLARTSWAGISWLLGGLIFGIALAEATYLVWFILGGGFNGD